MLAKKVLFCSIMLPILGLVTALPVALDDLICPDMDAANCYLKQFEPSHEWQIVKPGQIVPEGLHYKIDFETGIKQAKLLDESDNNSNRASNAIAVAQVDESASGRNIGGIGDETEVTPKNVVTERVQASVAGEGAKFNNALEGLLELFNNEKNKAVNIVPVVTDNHALVNDFLDTLVYSSHDLKYGQQIIEHNNLVVMFFSIINSDIEEAEIKEKLLRIISASIRNNEQSLLTIIENNSNRLFQSLVQLIDRELAFNRKESPSQILVKRAIGILNALIYNTEGLKTFEALKVEDFLSSKFNLLDSEVQERCSNLLNDANMLATEKLSHKSSDEL